MTAEIAIMNKDAIALAADSAVTIDTESGRKIYNTSNKLFAFSKHAPVGVMVYGRSDLMGVPWESIIKVYRAELRQSRFSNLSDYVGGFLRFLGESDKLFPRAQQLRYFRDSFVIDFFGMRKTVEQRVEALLKNVGQASFSDIQKLVDDVTQEFEKGVLARARLPHISDSHVKRLKTRFGSLIKNASGAIFGKIPISPKSAGRLQNIAVEKWCREAFDSVISGVVIAGFGQNDIFPSLVALRIDGVAEGIVRYEIFRRAAVNHGNTAYIGPFAQHEMVVSFMEGIDPNCRSIIEGYWNKILEQYPLDIVNAIPSLSGTAKQDLVTKLTEAGQNILKEFRDHLDSYQRKQYIDPVINAVAVLPKDMLAEMAESLVNLTSFKRRISMNSAETVGGPIDVAVISRGDGFVWIKRKHYFRPELNPQFFASILGGSYERQQEAKSKRQKATKKKTKT